MSDPAILDGVPILRAEGARRVEGGGSEPATLTAVPYCLWDNRRPGEMLVWIREA